MTIAFPDRAVRWAQPIRRSLLLLISALLITMVVSFGWFGHHRVHAVVEGAAHQRLATAANRLAGMLGENAVQLTHEIRQIAADPAVVAAVAAPHAPDSPRGTSLRALTRRPQGSSQTPSRVLWTLDCRRMASTGPLAPYARCPLTGAANAPAASIGPLRARGGSVDYELSAPVRNGRGDTVGYVSAVRTLTGGSAAAMSGLVGAGATLMLGNASGSFWTDLARQVPGPTVVPAAGRLLEAVDANGDRTLSIAHAVPGTPWLALVRMRQSAVAAPARRLLAEMALAAVLCLALGILGAWAISRRVTRPIAEITDAAAGIASGDYSRRVPVRRNDELGQLAAMFNSMAEQVHTASDELHTLAMDLAEQVQEAIDARRDTTTVQSLLDDVLASSPVGIAVLDPQLRYVKANPAIAALNGRPPASHYGNTPAQVDPAMGAVLEPLLTEVRATGAMIANRRVSAESRGAARHWLVTAFPVRAGDGHVSSVGLVILDTTAHQVLEAQFLQAQKMEAVGRLAGGVAHDFNNLLTVILSYSALALESLRPGDQLRGDMEEIRDAATRAAGLTRQLLAFSRNQVLQPQVICLNDTARGMDKLLRRLIGEDITFELRLAEDLHDVRADPGQMEQVIMNLVVNARDAMPDGGRVEIATANGPDGDVLLTVTDSGMGMSAETKEHLFEPFFTTKPAGKGTGLGLSTVYGIVTQSGGSVRVESEVGGGTTFTIRLPGVGEQAGTAGRVSPAAGTRLGKGTVLLVEDDQPLRALAARVLHNAGYVVLEAATAESALEVSRNFDGTIQLLLSDVVMPGRNGRALAELLRAERPDLRVLFMSGYTDDEVVRRGVIAQSSGFLQKPFTPPELAAAVRRAMEAVEEQVR